MTAYGLDSISIPNRQSLLSSPLNPGFPHVRSAQAWMWCGQLGQNVALNTWNEDWIEYICMYSLKTCIFICIMRSKSILIKLVNIYFKNSNHNLDYVEVICRIFFLFSKWICHVMDVSINRQLLSCKNCFGVLSWLCKEKCHKTFSDPNVSAGNITLCGVQHAARELGVERACLRAHPSSSLEAASLEGTSGRSVNLCIHFLLTRNEGNLELLADLHLCASVVLH